MNFKELVQARHSAVNFVKKEKLTAEEINNIFELTKLAPSAYNLQFTDYLVITDEEKKERIRELSYNQYKIHTASAVIIVMGNKNSIEMSEVEKIYQPMKMLKMMDDIEYDMTINQIKDFSENLKADPHKLETELVRNTGLQAMLLMLSAKENGFDTCPMHIHNVEQLREEFHIPNHLLPIMMITIGKSVDKTRPRGYRKPVGEFVHVNGFGE
ncbi:nitroreductase family protein [Metabacillus malikii]|uniref:NAD(P)H nitroreductase n=1 Tax=Metabacillus malikii TaxID=1504265 RepID=A0ABT9ZD02_9BACI|nr:nitroreductase family protein [Metabacillus malikii]MDQ0229130.1 putative NAD(P)H nitroreductase [Metabacillus malikii]